MERYKPFDRPAFTYDQGGGEVEILQQVGFLDEHGVPFQITLSHAIELGYIREGEIGRQTMPLSEAWKVYGR